MQLNSVLRGLNRVVLSPVERSNYRIRKQKDALSLSTVEAVYALYSQLESNAERYQPLLASFERMQAHQQNFYPPPITINRAGGGVIWNAFFLIRCLLLRAIF